MSLAGAGLVVLALSGGGSVFTITPLLFTFLASFGFVAPNMTALAMEAHGSRAGVASAVLGSAQYATAAGAASLVGLLNDGSLLPMAAVMGACALATWVGTIVTPQVQEAPGEGASASAA